MTIGSFYALIYRFSFLACIPMAVDYGTSDKVFWIIMPQK